MLNISLCLICVLFIERSDTLLNKVNTVEAAEICECSQQHIRWLIQCNAIKGAVNQKKIRSFDIPRYALYEYLRWSDEKIEEYHSSERGKFWLAFRDGRRKKNEPAGTDSRV